MVDPAMVDMFVTHWGEVAHREDCYALRRLPFVPKQIVDIGANVGTFSVWSKLLFPEAEVICYEPHPWNYVALRHFTRGLNNVHCHNRALATGPIYHTSPQGNPPGGNHTYLCQCVGYRDREPGELSDVPWSPLEDMVKGCDQVLVKVDTEGAENCIFESPDSLEALGQVDAFVMEIHYYANNGTTKSKVRQTIHDGIEELKHTHHCIMQGDSTWAHHILWGMKKGYPRWKYYQEST